MSLIDTVTSLLDAYGVDVTLQKRTTSAYSPTTDTHAATNTSEAARCFVVRNGETMGVGRPGTEGDLKPQTAADLSLFFGPLPAVSIGDAFTLNEKRYSILTASEIAFAGSIVGYKVTATR